jgi:hypothetical protein
MKFEKGDIVICVDPGHHEYLVKGRRYKVIEKCNDDLILIDNHITYYPSRFVLDEVTLAKKIMNSYEGV